ncbi:cytochrome C [Novosphingobium sp. PC22D]|uniref:c-type cytochrome n=1 Tax=Novosphingobium sp. PC22D TaxID=1962403 RepID=UPI000BF12380|nr:cytochrome c [Novosphingobium sp. PC22D]PEQ13651.1 cytochrome C [Novosphingobium sp. PC22D]
MRPVRAMVVPILGCALVAGCGKNMVQQARYDPYEKAPLFEDGMAMRAPPEGVVSRDAPQRRAATQRPAMSAALLARGRERYGIYCVPCHARDGSGNGIVPARGFPHPPDFHSERLKAASERHFYDVMTQGYGVMYAYADRVPPRDRWAIAAYIRALQATNLPEDRTEPRRGD